MKIQRVILLFIILNCQGALAVEWPELNWLNDKPNSEAVLSAITFVSPVDLQFFRMMDVWKKLDKRYHDFNVEFLIVARGEPFLPYSEDLVTNTIHSGNYRLPVLLDETASYAKLWRAYVSPTVNLVFRSGRVISFDSGNFDPVVFEKTLQRTLKDMGPTSLPSREFINESESKLCARPKTYFLGEKNQKALGAAPISFEKGWVSKPYWVEKTNDDSYSLEMPISKSNIAIVAQSNNPARIQVTVDGEKLSSDIKGLDIQEDKTGNSYINVKSARLYDITRYIGPFKKDLSKLRLITNSKGLKIWSIQWLPPCLDY